MRNLIIGLFVSLVACGHNFAQQKQGAKADTLDEYIGVFEYVNPGNTPELTENHYIVLTKSNDQLTGLYYGTSDEFDGEREGYLPGFFVSPMDDLQINGDTLRFVLNTTNSDFLTQPVDLKIHSTKEAQRSGYKNWDNKIATQPKACVGLIKDSGKIFFRGESDFLNKTFIKR